MTSPVSNLAGDRQSEIVLEYFRRHEVPVARPIRLAYAPAKGRKLGIRKKTECPG